MSKFTVAVYNAAGSSIMVPGNLDIQPQSWSSIAMGGPWDADILVNGGLAQLTGLTAWLGYRLEIINANGTAVWWGDVASVEITADGIRRGISLDRMANRIQMRYAQRQPGGKAIAADTAWTDDTLSQAAYGTWERRISPDRAMSASEAATQVATALGTLAQPHKTLVPDGGESSAHIYCTGYWQRTKRNYYSQLAGLEEHNVSGSAYPLGLGFTSSDVAFVSRTSEIHSVAGWLTNFSAGNQIKVAGSSSNNGAFTISQVNVKPAVNYVATSISFEASDDIKDSNAGLGFLETSDAFKVAGSASNSGTHVVDAPGAAAIGINVSFYGEVIAAEGAGTPITINRGNSVKVGSALTNEGVGSNVSVTAYGQRYYQTFALSVDAGSWTVAAIEIRLRRVGGPTDSVKVQLVANSGGSPGTLIEEITVAADDIPLEMGWVLFAFAGTSTLNYGTTYGITVLRTGANSPTDYYEIDVDNAATYTGGAMKQYDGATWQTPSPTCDLIFRVLGATDTAAQAAAAIGAQSWAAAVDSIASNITANQYRTGELRTADEVAAWLDMGTSAGTRLLATVRRNLTAVIYTQPYNTSARFMLQDGNRLLDLFGQDAEPGYLPAGEWVHLGDRANLGPWTALSPVFAERAEYRVGSGLGIEPEGSEDMWDTGVQG